MKTLIALTLTAAAALGGCAQTGVQTSAATPPAGRTCFMPRDVESWKTEGNEAVLFSVRRGEVWRARTLGPCQTDLDFANRIRLVPRTSSWICTGEDARLVVPSVFGDRERCDVEQFVKLSPEQVAALPAKQKP
jgi:hypothetical protein